MTIWDEAKDCAMMLTDYASRAETIVERAIARENKILAAITRGRKLEEALKEWIAACEAEAAAAKDAARVRIREYSKWPAMPKRIPKTAVSIDSLSPEERDRFTAQCALDMAPIDASETIHRQARERLVRAALALDEEAKS